MSEGSLWLLFVAIGLCTFALRLSFIELYGRLRVPPLLSRALVYVPASVLAALVTPAVVMPSAELGGQLDWPKIISAIVAAAVAWKCRNTLYTVIAGMSCLWLLQAWF
ncbi:branched-chain amino acid ABC transporter [Pokkaliibacter plantistimulans]|uniref:Branched-chain amino acid ABC transporter n=1 Tax=Proteobacteria bacterium 228 TaxID=2083153 RepID=A0A2S5KM77_9PROT|nr:AzlD domain-containing protein [Pokkaliibacter plantistimulans]PPC75840.1 branched-chain amino acid ABC transporter [Pokkaliibacter plantistimulans]